MKTSHWILSALLASGGLTLTANSIGDAATDDSRSTTQPMAIRVQIAPVTEGWSYDLTSQWTGDCRDGLALTGIATATGDSPPIRMQIGVDQSVIDEVDDRAQWISNEMLVIESEMGSVAFGVLTSDHDGAEYLVLDAEGTLQFIRISDSSMHRCVFKSVMGTMMIGGTAPACPSFSDCRSAATQICGSSSVCNFSWQGGDDCHCRFGCRDVNGNCK